MREGLLQTWVTPFGSSLDKKGHPGRRSLPFPSLPFPPFPELIYPIAADDSFAISELQIPGFQNGLRNNSFQGTLQVFVARLGLLKHPTLWTGQSTGIR